jgi:hypothetical protein
VAQLYLQALGSLFVASYHSQSYDGSIQTRLHAITVYLKLELLYEAVYNQSQVKVKVTLRLAVLPPISSSWRQAPGNSRHSNFTFHLNTCGYSPYVTSSQTRGWVCRLQLLLVLASTFILRSESRRTHDHILLSQIRDSPNLKDQVPVFISPRHWVLFLSPPTTHRATVEVFDPAFTRGSLAS